MRLVLSVLLLIILALMVWRSALVPGPAMAYPLVVSLCAFAAVLTLTILSLRKARVPVLSPLGDVRPTPVGWGRLAGFILLWIAYVALLDTAGFMLATWLALALSLALLGGRPTVRAALGTAVFVGVFAVLIKSVLYVPVPSGWLDDKLDFLLYSLS
ncbi:MAG: hypothetical protein K9H25_21015 [Rhodospirillum sp.]|nr:hypothetical protein [Rhodospirillum sp.]MCF8491468.1 hypothetical protein [Rhodospirillum sp.]MCF8498876.1 hypothetical protein [Rhodospirillum sp.]